MKAWPALALMIGLAACARQQPHQQASPTPTPAPHPLPATTSATGSAALPTPELDGVATAAGAWRFQVSADGDQAVFGDKGEPSEFALRCATEARRMVFTRAASGGGGTTMQIVAANGAATFDATPVAGGRVGASDFATDTFLTDVLAKAKDRIGVKIGEGATFAMPVDPVIAQTIKRCAAPKG